MEISAKVLREVEFSGSLRGYNTDEVDEFLEQVAVAVDRLQSESRLAIERAESERAGRDRAGIEDEESIRRTLVLAQRTADLAIKEAQEEAALLMDRTRAEAESVINEAHQCAVQLAAEAAQELRDEVERLAELRDSLRAETDGLVSLLDAERARLTESLSTALRYVQRTLTPAVATISPETPATAFAGAENDDAPGVLDEGGAGMLYGAAEAGDGDSSGAGADELSHSTAEATGDSSSYDAGAGLSAEASIGASRLDHLEAGADT